MHRYIEIRNVGVSPLVQQDVVWFQIPANRQCELATSQDLADR